MNVWVSFTLVCIALICGGLITRYLELRSEKKNK